VTREERRKLIAYSNLLMYSLFHKKIYQFGLYSVCDAMMDLSDA